MACCPTATFITTPASSFGHAFSRSASKLVPVRCSSDREGLGGRNTVTEATSLQEGIDSSAKKALSHEAEATSEQQSTIGGRPGSTAPWPRPEVKRRPEKGDRSLGSLFDVNGPGPETINGRLAMVGFVWAVVAEKMTGLTVIEQLFDPAASGLLWFGAVMPLFTVASIIPFANGESPDARSWGPFNAHAERWNGRLAMLGFSSLLFAEMIKQAPLFH